MSIKQQIEKDFIKALKEKDKSLDVLRMTKNAIKNTEIEKRKDLADDEIMAVLQKEKKQREDSIKEFQKGKRADLIEKEKNEIKVIEKYLPKALSDDEIKKQVLEAIKETKAESFQDMGEVMGKVMPQLKGKADGAVVSRITKSELENLG